MPNLKAEIRYLDYGVAVGALLDMARDYEDMDECTEEAIKMCLRSLNRLPKINPADLVPKGRWENVSYWKAKDGRLRLYTAKRCPICGRDARKKAKHNFCPNCGADMRGGGDGTA